MDDVNEIESDDVIVELTADIVAAYVSNNVVQLSDLPGIIADVHHALRDTHGSPESAVIERGEPAVPVRKSVKDDEIICLEGSVALTWFRHVESRTNRRSRGFRKEFSHEVDLVGNADPAIFELSLSDGAESFDASESRLGAGQGLEASHRAQPLL